MFSPQIYYLKSPMNSDYSSKSSCFHLSERDDSTFYSALPETSQVPVHQPRTVPKFSTSNQVQERSVDSTGEHRPHRYFSFQLLNAISGGSCPKLLLTKGKKRGFLIKIKALLYWQLHTQHPLSSQTPPRATNVQTCSSPCTLRPGWQNVKASVLTWQGATRGLKNVTAILRSEKAHLESVKQDFSR